jgi:hypothetical protein
MASILLTIFRINETSQRTLVDLKDWFSHLPPPSLIKSAEPLALTPIYRESITDDFLIGLIEGDGCFGVGFKANAKIEVFFHITQSLTTESKILLNQCNQYLGNIGNVTEVNLDHHRYARWNINGIGNQLNN